MNVVDLFAGLGGMSAAAVAAGHRVLLAANHWPAAVRAHAVNHPEVEHWTQDLQQADWIRVPRHDLLLASPACQGHSRARGKERPHHDAARSTAWAVVSCAEYHRPAAIVVENVVDYRRWVLYPAWRQALAALGYAVAEHVLDAADHGVPQQRVRLYLVATRSLFPPRLRLPRRPHVAAPVEWGAGRWTSIGRAGRSPRTLARIAAGRAALGDRFVVSYYGTTRTGRSADRPLGTVTTRDRWAAVDGDQMRMLSVDEYRRAMGFPDGYVVPSEPKALGVHLLGNAACPPVVTDLIEALEAA